MTVRTKAKSVPHGNMGSPAETTGPRTDAILDITGQPIDPIWEATFRGFFWGEGCLFISTHRSVLVQSYIGLRSDDAAILREFQRRLGGTITLDAHGYLKSKPVVRWKVHKAEDNYRIGFLLAKERLPFRKAKELATWRKAVQFKMDYREAANGRRYGPKVRAEVDHLVLEIRKIRKWRRNN